ncbi:MAG: outer membrane lipoprotein carrier protein LolA [Acetobacteraceae bacterium]|nr:outer membrane lipoprotein carrier protein LolA [Acetobacteraceae bacterium]
MKRRALLALGLLPLCVPAGAQPARVAAAPQPRALALSAADRTDVARIEAYLNGLRTLRARFLQVAPDGAISQGNAWIERPGRMRFEYDPPSPLLLVAGNGGGMFYDKQLKQVTSFPLSSTPLGILLADKLKLEGAVTISGIERMPGQIQVSMFRTDSPGDGSLTLVFADKPLSLRQWMITDPQQRETTVSLFNVALGGRFDQKLFETADPRLLE